MVMSMPQTRQGTVAIIATDVRGPDRATVKRQARTMTKTLRKLDTQHDSSLTEAARSAPNGGFKRLALPAVAAAVHTLAQAKPRQPAPREWPEFLRREEKAS
jgi:hypothetical protein